VVKVFKKEMNKFPSRYSCKRQQVVLYSGVTRMPPFIALYSAVL
jgi:hypothetical protein